METKDTAIFAMGCFWCGEAIYSQLEGVLSVNSGYIGGAVQDPTYEQVCSGNTGHAEALEIIFDSSLISYSELLEVFWKVHDPTTLNRQGNDEGTQYRSAIFYLNEDQKEIALISQKAVEEAELYANKIVTVISKSTQFYPAGAKHKDYYKNNPQNQYCHFVVGPKVEKFKKLFKSKLKTGTQ